MGKEEFRLINFQEIRKDNIKLKVMKYTKCFSNKAIDFVVIFQFIFVKTFLIYKINSIIKLTNLMEPEDRQPTLTLKSL